MLKWVSWISLVSLALEVLNHFRDNAGWFREGNKIGDELWVVVGDYRNEFSIGAGRELKQTEFLGIFTSEDAAKLAIEKAVGHSIDWVGHISQGVPGIDFFLYDRHVGDTTILDMQVQFAADRAMNTEERLNRDVYGFYSCGDDD